MRLLETESLETAILHSGITLHDDVHEFYGALWQLIKQAEQTADDAAMPALEKQLRTIMRDYYSQTDDGVFDASVAEDMPGDDPVIIAEWRMQSVRARELVKGYERQLQRYVLCYMHLGRALAQARTEVEKIARLYPQQEASSTLKLNDVTGMLVARAYRQKKETIEKRARLLSLKGVLEDLQERFALLREDLYGIMPAQNVERAYIAFRALLRQGDLKGARMMVAQWTDLKPLLNRSAKRIVRDNALRITQLLEENGEGLKMQEGYMMEQSEIRLLFSFLDGEEARVDTFLRKYMVPYMVFKLRHLLTMARRLGRIGTLEGLLVLHARLVGGILRPMTDMAQVKRYEQEVVARAGFLLKNGFPDLTHIFNESEVAFEDIRRLFSDAHMVGSHIGPAPSEL